MPSYFVSLLKAWCGEAATPENGFGFDRLPRISEDHSMYQIALGMREKTVKGLICAGQNPAVGSANAGLYRRAMADLEWLVVRDFVESETAAFWYDSQEIEDGDLRTEDIGTEVFFLPAAAQTGEERFLHQHPAAGAMAPQGGRAARGLPLGAVVLLPPGPDHPREAGRLG